MKQITSSILMLLLAALALAENSLDQGGEDCATALAITALPFSDTGTLGLTDDCVGRPYNDVFYSFTAITDGTYLFDLCGSAGDTYLKIWTEGTCCTGDVFSTDAGCGDDPRVGLDLLAGETIYLEGGVWGALVEPTAYSFHAAQARAGETCTAPRTVGELPFSDSDTLGLVDNCAGRPYNDIFYRFTAPAAGVYNLDMCGSAADASMEVWLNGVCCTGPSVLTDLGCGDDPRATFVLAENQTVMIECGAGSNQGNPPAYAFHVRAAAAGEICSTAVEIPALPFTLTDTLGFVDNCTGQPFNDRFFRFTALAEGDYAFDLCGSEGRTALRLWTGGTCGTGASVLAAQACDEEDVTQTLHLIAGQTVYAECGAWANQLSPGLFSLHVYEPLPGENCGSALPLPGLPCSITGSTGEFHHDYDAACPTSGGTARDVVYRWIPPVDQWLNISLCRSDSFDTRLYVYENSCAGAPLACSDDAYPCPGADGFTQSYLDSIPLLAGGSYYIVIDGHGTADSGSFVLEVEESHALCALECPPGARLDTEPLCADNYVDSLNGGCDANPHVFIPIACGDVICGTSGTYHRLSLDREESDWFVLNLAQPESIVWCVQAEFPARLTILTPDAAGGCDAAPVLATASNWEWHCDTLRTGLCLDPGSYWLALEPAYSSGVDCGLDYVTWLECAPCGAAFCDCAYLPNSYYNDLPHVLTYPDTTVMAITVPLLPALSDVDVCLHLEIAQTMLVGLWLRSPGGVDVELSTANGDGADYACTTFDDEAATTITLGSPPFAGSFSPETPLSVLDGSNPAGTWQLRAVLADTTMAGSLLNGACLMLTSASFTCLPVTDLTMIVSDVDTSLVLRWTVPDEGLYQVWSSVVRTNDGNPDGGNDMDWALEHSETYPFGPAEWSTESAARYKNYVVLHVCE